MPNKLYHSAVSFFNLAAACVCLLAVALDIAGVWTLSARALSVLVLLFIVFYFLRGALRHELRSRDTGRAVY